MEVCLLVKKNFYKADHNILELYSALPQVRFAISKTKINTGPVLPVYCVQ